MKKHRILPIFLAVLLCLCTQVNAAVQPDISTDTPLSAAAEAGEGFSDASAVSDNVSTDAPASALVASMSAAAKAALLVDMDTDYIMYAQNAFERIYPASITKVMTALLVLDAVDDGMLALDDVVTAGETAWDGLDYTSSNQNIRAGEQMRVEDLLYCLMLASANEAG
ncbi:MAG: serine hydrolase, partial [Oscillospiraceae bacterium]|nr:serine hydrolase [Oscillospiraceae bacterium]